MSNNTIPTVKVKRDGPKGYRIINESDFDPAKHERADGATAAIIPDLTQTNSVSDDKIVLGDQVAVPEGWQALHWTKQEALAVELVGGEGPLVASEGQTRAEKAKAIINATVNDRADA